MKEKIFAIAVIFALFAVPVLADTQTFTVTFSIPSSISHSLSYGSVVGEGTCSNSIFYFREGDGTIDGSQGMINVSDASGNACQNTTVSALSITNNGNTAVNVTEMMNATVTGVVVRVSQQATQISNTSSCIGIGANQGCANITAVPITVVYGLASSGTANLWHWADFSSADVGAGAGSAGSTTRLVTTNATG